MRFHVARRFPTIIAQVASLDAGALNGAAQTVVWYAVRKLLTL